MDSTVKAYQKYLSVYFPIHDEMIESKTVENDLEQLKLDDKSNKPEEQSEKDIEKKNVEDEKNQTSKAEQEGVNSQESDNKLEATNSEELKKDS